PDRAQHPDHLRVHVFRMQVEGLSRPRSHQLGELSRHGLSLPPVTESLLGLAVGPPPTGNHSPDTEGGVRLKTRMLVFSTIAAVVALTSATLASGVKPPPRPVKFSAALNVGQERPHPKGTKVGAAGRFTATLTGTTLHWRLTFAHLSGPAT